MADSHDTVASRPRDWSALGEDLASLDLRLFLGGRNPHAAHDNSIDNAYRLGKAFYEGAVRERVGFRNGRVLDLLAGFGRWLPFLAEVNREVVAIERSSDCMTLAGNLCAHFGFDNVRLMTGGLERIEELTRASFDYVWMWSGLQYVERGYALQQIHRVLKPSGRVFIGAYNATGLMLEHVQNGAEAGALYDGAAGWALSALARGPQGDGNPNYMDLEGLEEMCRRFKYRLIAAAPQNFMDVQLAGCRTPGWEAAPRVGRYLRTIEFLLEKP